MKKNLPYKTAEAFYREEYPFLIKSISRNDIFRTISKDERFDIAHDVFEKAINQNIWKGTKSTNITACLFLMAKHKAIDRFRKNKVKEKHLTGLASDLKLANAEFKTLEKEDNITELLDIAQKDFSKTEKVLLKAMLARKTVKEISKQIGWSTKKTRNNLEKIKAKILWVKEYLYSLVCGTSQIDLNTLLQISGLN